MCAVPTLAPAWELEKEFNPARAGKADAGVASGQSLGKADDAVKDPASR